MTDQWRQKKKKKGLIQCTSGSNPHKIGALKLIFISELHRTKEIATLQDMLLTCVAERQR